MLVGAVKDCGLQLSRSALVSSLEGLKNFRTGVLSPISFSPNRKVGTTESCMVRIDVVRRPHCPEGTCCRACYRIRRRRRDLEARLLKRGVSERAKMPLAFKR